MDIGAICQLLHTTYTLFLSCCFILIEHLPAAPAEWRAALDLQALEGYLEKLKTHLSCFLHDVHVCLIDDIWGLWLGTASEKVFEIDLRVVEGMNRKPFRIEVERK